MKTLYYGDNLDVLRRYIADESVDLVYLDPPFKSDQNYNVLFAEHGVDSAAQIQAFEDTWHWDQSAAAAYQEVVEGGGSVSQAMQAFRTFLGDNDMLAYLSMMAPRLMELRRVLKQTGSIYLHCDPTASHYLKMLMDAVFSPDHFVSEIIWKRHNARSTEGRWPRIHDSLLCYSRSDTFLFNAIEVAGDMTKIPHTLITGPDGKKYQTYELTGPGVTKEGESGKPWKGFDPTSMGRHWANSQSTMNEWNAAGLIHWARAGKAGGFPRRRDAEPFVPEARMITVGDVWTDIDRINQAAKERLGYPTQKPEALLERIIRASSNEGDVVLDPFCGCGTTVAAAQKLNRQWLGIDITHLAVNLVKHRLRDAFGDVPFDVTGEPTDIDGAKALAEQDRFQFQCWALGLFGARSEPPKRGADKGIDGRLYFHEHVMQGSKTNQVIFSVKSGSARPTDLRDLRGVINREKAAIGVFVTLNEPTREMKKEAASAGYYETYWGPTLGEKQKHPKLQIYTIAELLEGKQADLPRVHRHELKTFKKAPKAKAPRPKEQQREMFGDE